VERPRSIGRTMELVLFLTRNRPLLVQARPRNHERTEVADVCFRDASYSTCADERTNERLEWDYRSRESGRCNDTHRLASEGDVIAGCTHHVAAVRWLGAVRAARRKGGQAANETTVLAICYLDNRHRRRRRRRHCALCRSSQSTFARGVRTCGMTTRRRRRRR